MAALTLASSGVAVVLARGCPTFAPSSLSISSTHCNAVALRKNTLVSEFTNSEISSSFFSGSLVLNTPTFCPGRIVMAVPKKRMSRTKTKIRRAIWSGKAKEAAKKAFSLASSVLTGRSKSFLYEVKREKKAKDAGTDAADETP
eukprot:jgi/Mesen1/4640/ME000241S03673